jgi:hypothetical protein
VVQIRFRFHLSPDLVSGQVQEKENSFSPGCLTSEELEVLIDGTGESVTLGLICETELSLSFASLLTTMGLQNKTLRWL